MSKTNTVRRRNSIKAMNTVITRKIYNFFFKKGKNKNFIKIYSGDHEFLPD